MVQVIFVSLLVGKVTVVKELNSDAIRIGLLAGSSSTDVMYVVVYALIVSHLSGVSVGFLCRYI